MHGAAACGTHHAVVPTDHLDHAVMAPARHRGDTYLGDVLGQVEQRRGQFGSLLGAATQVSFPGSGRPCRAGPALVEQLDQRIAVHELEPYRRSQWLSHVVLCYPIFMGDHAQLSMTEEGHLAVSKRAPNGLAADRLRREVDVLRRAAHPGVVELLGVDDGEDGIVVHTAFVGGGTLAEHLGTMTAGRGTRVAASVATTLADLHDRAVAHGQVSADHVLVTDADQTRLCGMAEAVLGTQGDLCPPEAAEADVEALAILARTMAERCPGEQGSALRAVADRVLRAGTGARPSMRTLAQTLAGQAGELPSTPAPSGRTILPARSPSGRRPPRRRLVVAGAGALVVVVLGAGVVGSLGDADPETASPPPPPAPASTSSPAPSPPTTPTAPMTAAPTTTAAAARTGGARVWPPTTEPGCAPSGSGLRADIDGNGCPEAVELGRGVVTVADQRWQVAGTSDVVVVGDWNCDGVATAAVVRTTTGSVWAYQGWGDGAEADRVGTVRAPVSARTVPGEEGCDQLEITDAAGTRRLPVEPIS